MKELKATRVPPGDRWAIVDDDKEKIYSSLTECLNAIFMQTGIGEFYMDAKAGEVHIEDGKVKPKCSYESLVAYQNNIPTGYPIIDVVQGLCQYHSFKKN